MKIAVLGAGIIGISTAFELAKSGFNVTVFDKNSGPAEETSFANAGLIAPGHAFSWNSPNLLLNLIKPQANANSAFKIKFPPSLKLTNWGLKFLKNCSNSKFIEYSNAKRNLSSYSHKILKTIITEEKISCYYNPNGIYYLHRSENGLKKAITKINNFPELINDYEILDSNLLGQRDSFFKNNVFNSALIYNSDGSGDCYLFANQLMEKCIELGVKFKFNSKINKLNLNKNRVQSIDINNEKIKADNFILSFGPFSQFYQNQIKTKIPVYPVKGYSLTIPILKDNSLPKMSGIDEDNFLAFSRFGNNMRITSRAEFSTFKKDINPTVIKHLLNLTQNIFKDSLDYNNVKVWTGFRAVTPKGTPYICKSKIENLFLNTGHGHLGWTMASGSAKIISNLIQEKTQEIVITPFHL
mgnify:CR=1 FL=1